MPLQHPAPAASSLQHPSPSASPPSASPLQHPAPAPSCPFSIPPAASCPSRALRLAGRCLCVAPSQPRCGQIMAPTSLLLLLLFYLHWDTISDKASVGRFLWQSSHDIWLQTAWAYPTPPMTDNFKGTGSPFSCFSCPNSSSSRALILARLFIKCISVTLFTGLDLRRNLGFWPDKPKLGWANLLKIEVLWTFQFIFVRSWGSKIWLRSWTFPLLLLSFETRFFPRVISSIKRVFSELNGSSVLLHVQTGDAMNHEMEENFGMKSPSPWLEDVDKILAQWS